ncbi:MAG: gliding motility-associated C-terminal domain-containing protein, partial [Bacteroidota bacterium]|nr:gliding motility-associated C-terminal domain-containing protein [Bacteroidota bacterium]
EETYTLTVYLLPNVVAGSNSPVCAGEDILLTETGGNADSWEWSGPDGFTSDVNNPIITSVTTAADGIYSVTVIDNNGCTGQTSLDIQVYENADATIIDPVDSMLVTDPPVDLDAVDNGGEWSGNGIDPVTGEFTPQEAGIGDHQINYIIEQICGDADSIIIVVSSDQIEDLLIPDVVTPNDDDYNDTWRIRGIRAYNKVAIYIFTRWGEKVFEFTGTGDGYHESENQWDGTWNGKKLPFGTYVYILELDNDDSYKGTVTLIY